MEVEGVLITESKHVTGAKYLGPVSVEINRQNSNLAAVRLRLAQEVRRLGGNCLGGFEYGQRAHRWWQLFAFRWDTEMWFGKGDALYLDEEARKELEALPSPR
jgi:hypothetical protein